MLSGSCDNRSLMETAVKKPCLRCLLHEADENELAEIIAQRIAAMPDAQKTTSEEYQKRLKLCKMCDYLISGTCQKCGCYVELRAVRKNSVCPHENPKW